MEEDRIELIKGNVWEYANLGSSTLLVQDEVLVLTHNPLSVTNIFYKVVRKHQNKVRRVQCRA